MIHNAADHILRVRPDEDEVVKPPYFLVFGSQAPHKNVETVLKAAAAYENRDIPLVIAGGSNGRIFQNTDAGDSEGIIRLGRLSDEALVSLYQKATALLFPSLTEGFGIPPLEAMQLGCPVVASDGGAIPEVCGEAALYVSPRDVEGWVKAMQRIASDAGLRQELRDKGFARAARFTWTDAARGYLELIADLAASGSRRVTSGEVNTMPVSGNQNTQDNLPT